MPFSESPVARNALVILAVIASGATLYVLAGILTPLALAMFLAVMIDGFARVLQHRLPHISKRAALPLAVMISILLFGGTAFFVAENATGFATQLVAYEPKLDAVIAQLAGVVRVKNPPTVISIIRGLDATKYLGFVARFVQDFASTALFVLVYLAFILASRRGWERKAIGLFPQREERQEAVVAFLRIRDGVERYLFVQTITGLMVAGLSWIAMAAVGLHDALFWAFLIFLAVYIPVAGGVFAGVAPPLFALVQFDGYGRAIILLIALQLIGMIIGNVVYPRMQGRSLNLDPVMVLLALAFWSAIWGLTGAFLSTPLTVMAMVVLAQFDGSRWIAVILSADGDPQQLKNKMPNEPPDEALPPPSKGPAARPARRLAKHS
ncbi:MAG: conserved predicted permease protein [Phenylobacterium sp.]|uniref:AI-2E family transporter n=1 Tax=Phenylobacterium sp. TaxID=1871053 RepID=UPI00262E82F7|nr:AI-2E family transporter [Phenylobacterium sp.]MDB5437449.1 conserved predicted permease protein [Phenylobacterium sp.]MDB5496354.1 conserved predicted permease protein [Phenylobacterium sp.]